MKRKRVEQVVGQKRITRQSVQTESLDDEKNGIKDDQESTVNSGEQLSEYEKKRLENMRKNEEMMISLNFKQTAQELSILKDSNRKKSYIGLTSRPKPKTSLQPVRRSPRIKGKSADLQTPFYEPPLVVSTPERERKPSGPIEMTPANDIDGDESQTFLNNLRLEKDKSQVDVKNWSSLETMSLERYKEKISKLHILPNNVAKIVPKRIYSMAFHPSSTKLIICAGDKWGSVGLWDMDAVEESSSHGIFIYEPHSGPVTGLSFHPNRNNNLFSCSYDGTVRCGDFTKSIFDEVYSSEDYASINSLSYPCSSRDTIVLACSDGQVALVDSRENKSTNSLYKCHLKSIKCIHCSPTDPNLFCTASADASVALWDIRRMKNTNSKLDSVRFGRSVTSAYFSPVSGQHILTTSYDDYVKVFELSSSLKLENKRTFKHFNHTGRWLTPFKAAWDPKNDCGIVIGSMLSNRRVEIYHSEQSGNSPIVQLFDDNYGTITSINVFHHSRNVIACGNSSGKVYMWTERKK